MRSQIPIQGICKATRKGSFKASYAGAACRRSHRRCVQALSQALIQVLEQVPLQALHADFVSAVSFTLTLLLAPAQAFVKLLTQGCSSRSIA